MRRYPREMSRYVKYVLLDLCTLQIHSMRGEREIVMIGEKIRDELLVVYFLVG